MCVVGGGGGHYGRGLVAEDGCELVLGGGWGEGIWGFLGRGFWWMLIAVVVLRVGCGARGSVAENVGGW